MLRSFTANPLYPGSEINFEELTKDEIKFIQGEVARTLKLAKRAGADAVEIHAYGGGFENRMRFLNEIIDNTQNDLGNDFPLIIKYTPTHHLPTEAGYRGMEEGLRIAKMLEDKGVHALHVDVGCHNNWYMAMAPIYQQEMATQLAAAQQVKGVSSLPVLSHGRLGDKVAIIGAGLEAVKKVLF